MTKQSTVSRIFRLFTLFLVILPIIGFAQGDQLESPIFNCNEPDSGEMCFSWPSIEGAIEYAGVITTFGAGPITFNQTQTSYCISGVAPNVELTLELTAIAEDEANNSEATIGSCTTMCIPDFNSYTPDQTICFGQSTSISFLGNGDVDFWSTGASTNGIFVTPSETTTYTVYYTDVHFCDQFEEITVFVEEGLTADAGPDQIICVGESATLTASGGISYTWNTGQLGSTITVNPVITNTYEVTVTNVDGCTGIDEVTIFVEGTAYAGPDQTVCQGQPATLSAIGGTAYLWSNGESTQEITVQPEITTTYSVTVSSDCGEDAVDDVIVFVGSTTANAGPDQTICQGETAMLIASGGMTYQWSTGGSNASIVVNLIVNTTFTVTVTDSNGCQDTDEVTVTVVEEIDLEVSSDQTICQGENAILTASGAYNYAWSNGQTGSSITVNPSSTTTYVVYAESGSDCEETAEVTIFVNELDLPQTQTICEGGSGVLAVNDLGGFTYDWSTGQSGPAITASPESPTTYYVTATGPDCTIEDSIALEIMDPSTFPIANAGEDQAICPESTIVLSASGGVEFLWSTGETTQEISVSPVDETSYTVTVFNECGNDDTDDVTVFVSEVVADVGPDQTICQGENLIINGTGGISYQWSTGQTSASITANPSNTTTYSLTVTNPLGCQDETEITVAVEPCDDFNPQDDFINVELNDDESGFYLYLLENDELPEETFDFSVEEDFFYGSFTGDIPSQLSYEDANLPSITYTAPYGTEGEETFTYTLCKTSTGACKTASVTLQLSSPISDPEAPICEDDFGQTFQNTASEFDVLANDFDFEEAGLSISDVGDPSNGSISIVGDPNMLFYSPNLGFSGTDSVQYTAENIFGETDSAWLYITVLPTDIWPGDINTDGVSNNYDVLALGLAVGLSGPERLLGSSDWLAQYCPEWEDSISLSNAEIPELPEIISINAKHTDCNGNGIVELIDVDIISQNYNQTVPRLSDAAAADAPLIWIEMPDILEENTWVTANINIGTPEATAEDIHGFAYTIVFDPTIVDPLSISIDFSENWMAGEENISLVEIDEETGRVDMAFSRTDQMGVSGFGTVAKANIFIIDNIDGKQEALDVELDLEISYSRIMNSDGEFLAMEESSAQATVLTAVEDEEENATPSILEFWPNPAQSQLFLGPIHENIHKLSIYNIQGQKMYEITPPLSTNTAAPITVQNWPEGIYFMEWVGPKGQHSQKFQIIR